MKPQPNPLKPDALASESGFLSCGCTFKSKKIVQAELKSDWDRQEILDCTIYQNKSFCNLCGKYHFFIPFEMISIFTSLLTLFVETQKGFKHMRSPILLIPTKFMCNNFCECQVREAVINSVSILRDQWQVFKNIDQHIFKHHSPCPVCQKDIFAIRKGDETMLYSVLETFLAKNVN